MSDETKPEAVDVPRLTDEQIRFAATLLRPYRHLLAGRVGTKAKTPA